MRGRYVLRRAKNRRKRQSRVPSLGRGLWRGLKLGVSAAVTAAALGGALTGVYFGWDALQRSARLQIRHIDVLGAERTNRAELIACAGVRLGDPVLRVDLDAAALRLRRHPWIGAATVRRRLPDTLTIEVQEQQPALLVSLGDVYIANARGRVFKRLRAADRLSLPVLTGLDAEAAATQAESVARRIRDAVGLAKRIADSGALLGRVDELHWDEDLGWSVELSRAGAHSSAVRAHLGKRAEQALPVAERALVTLQRLGGQPEVLWVDAAAAGNKDMVQVRLADRHDASGASQQARPAQQRPTSDPDRPASSAGISKADSELAYLEIR